jgi:hypothetical protein
VDKEALKVTAKKRAQLVVAIATFTAARGDVADLRASFPGMSESHACELAAIAVWSYG